MHVRRFSTEPEIEDDILCIDLLVDVPVCVRERVRLFVCMSHDNLNQSECIQFDSMFFSFCCLFLFNVIIVKRKKLERQRRRSPKTVIDCTTIKLINLLV